MKRIPYATSDLHPAVRSQFDELTRKLFEGWKKGEVQRLLAPFEGYRDPNRQDRMVTEGVSKAKAWLSAHQYGLAVDYVPDGRYWPGGQRIVPGNPQWSWPAVNDPCWRYLGETAASCGLLQPIAWDKPHIQSPLWQTIKSRL